jgi:arylsulfatase A-like enzyme
MRLLVPDATGDRMSPTFLTERLAAACAGAGVGAAYGVVETVCAVVLRGIAFPATFVPPHPLFSLLLCLVYPLLGFALLFIVGRSRLAVLPLVLAFAANAVMTTPGLALAVPLSGCAIVLTALMLRWEWLTNGWSAATLLLAPIWISREFFFSHSFAVRATSAVIATAVIVTVSWLLFRRFRISTTATVTVFAMTTLVAAFLHAPSPRNVEAPVVPPRERVPNVVFIVMDTVRADHLSLYGYPRRTTPGLEAFARGATTYDRAYAPSNMTLSTHAALFTGKYASEHGAHYDEGWSAGRPLAPGLETIAQTLSARGYATGSIAANYVYLGTEFGLDRGFQYLDARPPRAFFGAPWNFYLRARLATWAAAAFSLPPRTHLLARGAEEINDSAISWLGRTSRRRPFFLFVNYMDAHAPCIAPEEFDRRFPGRDPAEPVDLADRLLVDMGNGRLKMTAGQRADLEARYDGAIAYVDEQVSVLLGKLRSMGVYDSTLIVVASDHGEAFGDHGIIGHGTSNYEDQIHVPMLVKRPGQLESERVVGPVSLLEIFPMISGHPGDAFPVVSESFPMRGPLSLKSYCRSGTALVSGTRKVIVNTRGARELYDVRSDPGELRNLASQDVAGTARLSSEVRAWQRSLVKRASDQKRPIDPELERRLRALGYIR